MTEIWEGVQRLFDRGGLALWAILGCALWIWIQLAQCYLEIAADRRERRSGSGDERVPLWRVQDVRQRLEQVRALLPVPPMLGLLGTVVGMIEAFDALAIFGNANARSLSFGVSRALLTTMGGLLASVLGLFAMTPIRRWLVSVHTHSDAPETRALAFSPLLILRARLAERSLGDETLP